jgi:hypothetical protein
VGLISGPSWQEWFIICCILTGSRAYQWPILAGMVYQWLHFSRQLGLSVIMSSQQWFSSGYLLYQEAGLINGHIFAGMGYQWLHLGRKGGLSVVTSWQEWVISGYILVGMVYQWLHLDRKRGLLVVILRQAWILTS